MSAKDTLINPNNEIKKDNLKLLSWLSIILVGVVIGSYINVSPMILTIFGIHFLIEFTLMENNWLQRTMHRRAALSIMLFVPTMFSIFSSIIVFNISA